MQALVRVGCAFAAWLVLAPRLLPAQAPNLPPNSVVNGASFRPATDPGGAVAPGTIISIFGTNLVTASEVSQIPLAAALLDTSVIIRAGNSSVVAPLYAVLKLAQFDQINAQMPFEAPVGTLTVEVRRGSESSAAQPLEVAAVSPGIFIMDQAANRGAIVNALSFRLVSESEPARPGDFLSIFCTGLGVVEPPVPSGRPAPEQPLSATVLRPQVNIGGAAAEVTFSGLAPRFVGLYQVNVRVPAGVPAGPQPVEIIINNVRSNTVTLAIAP